MRIGRSEIIEELTEHIRRYGGQMGEWYVGTSSHANVQIQDAEPRLPGLAHREAHTAFAAAEAVEYLVDAFGVRLSPASKAGHFVFVYRAALETAGAHR